MSKTMVVTDSQYDWFCARARQGRTMAQVVDHVITLVNRTEKDLEKYRKWVDASDPKPKKEKLL